ncbi:hypothetical protein EI555_015772 [Monodon monoceros]|uniref:Uncharacterized protein n=1 Tax=Monodon monoceros TaxID=40151 RepID=A0A4U1FIS0_MONMO|nr:hypothetical protein EI555_015772 [Monodon monoceros]
MYDHVTDQAVKTVESHPNIQLEFTFFHLPRQYVTVDGPGMLPHLVEGVGMALPLSRPQFLQASFPCQTGCETSEQAEFCDWFTLVEQRSEHRCRSWTQGSIRKTVTCPIGIVLLQRVSVTVPSPGGLL